MKTLTSPADVIDELGGNRAVAEMFGYADPRRVFNWRSTRLPARTYVAMQAALKARGLRAPDSLWGMDPVPEGVAAPEKETTA